MSSDMKKIAKQAKKYRSLLILMRHAKADSHAETDQERELTEKGYKQAKKVAKGLSGLGLVPDAIVCSGALRTRQTLEKMLKVFGDAPTVEYRQSLYDSGKQAVWDELAQAHEETERLMIIGHEPVISMTAGSMATKDSDSALLALLHVGVSNAAVVMLGSDKPFGQWSEHDAELLAVLTPKDFS